MTDFALHHATIDAFVEGKLDPAGEADLADRVARILPFHALLPNPMVVKLKRVLDHLGGEQALLAWLDRYPGRPRVVARLFAFIAMLDQYGAEPAVVSALREFRTHTRYPPGLEKYLVPQTDDETLASLSWEVESYSRTTASTKPSGWRPPRWRCSRKSRRPRRGAIPTLARWVPCSSRSGWNSTRQPTRDEARNALRRHERPSATAAANLRASAGPRQAVTRASCARREAHVRGTGRKEELACQDPRDLHD